MWDKILDILRKSLCNNDGLLLTIANLKSENSELHAENRRLRQLFVWSPEVSSPSDIVPRDGIYYNGDGLLTVDLRKMYIELDKPPSVWIPDIPDTGSMDPVFDSEHNNILISGQTLEDHEKIVKSIKLGDIVVARIPPDYALPSTYYVIHRVWKIGQDYDSGIYYILKGDHNQGDDGIKVRAKNILHLSIGTIY